MALPALVPTRFTGRVTWLGVVVNRRAGLASRPLREMQLGFAGFAGESHAGLTRLSDSRVLDQYPRGTEIRNVRQISIVSAEELAAIASEMSLEAIDPAWLGAGLVVSGIPDFTLIPPSSRLQADSGATLTVDMENRPCSLPAREVEHAHPGRGRRFKTAADRRRGVTAWVEREGILRIGCVLRLHVPSQPGWPHLDATRRAGGDEDTGPRDLSPHDTGQLDATARPQGERAGGARGTIGQSTEWRTKREKGRKWS